MDSASPDPPRAEPAPLSAPTRHLAILVVDDDQPVREAICWMLVDAGHTVHEAADGVDALAHLAAQGQPDLLITDIDMPRMNGLQLLHQLGERFPTLPVLVVSARPPPPGTTDFMAKPFGWDALMRSVARLAGHPRIEGGAPDPTP